MVSENRERNSHAIGKAVWQYLSGVDRSIYNKSPGLWYQKSDIRILMIKYQNIKNIKISKFCSDRHMQLTQYRVKILIFWYLMIKILFWSSNLMIKIKILIILMIKYQNSDNSDDQIWWSKQNSDHQIVLMYQNYQNSDLDHQIWSSEQNSDHQNSDIWYQNFDRGGGRQIRHHAAKAAWGPGGIGRQGI